MALTINKVTLQDLKSPLKIYSQIVRNKVIIMRNSHIMIYTVTLGDIAILQKSRYNEKFRHIASQIFRYKVTTGDLLNIRNLRKIKRNKEE